jgi:hypothetical protein
VFCVVLSRKDRRRSPLAPSISPSTQTYIAAITELKGAAVLPQEQAHMKRVEKDLNLEEPIALKKTPDVLILHQHHRLTIKLTTIAEQTTVYQHCT